MRLRLWYVGTLCATLLVVVGGYYFVHRVARFVVPDLGTRAGTASSEYLNAQRAAGFYRDEIEKHPENTKNYIELAQLFLQEARVTGRHHEYLPKAQSLIDEVIRREPENVEANLTKGMMMLTMHQFRGAEELAGKCIASNPHSATSYGILCDAEVELGNYDEAVKVCDRMLAIRPDLRSYSRASYIREIHGDDAGAVGAMKLASDAGMPGQENRAWVLYNLGKLYLNEGKLDTADYIFNGILAERPDYAYALSGLSQVRREKGDVRGAVLLLSRAYQITPEHLFVEQLADLYQATGDKQSEEGVVKIVLSMFEQHEKGGWNVNREYAMFCANHDINIPEALRRARREYDSRPDNIDVLDTYAWTLYKAGKGAEAVPYIERAMRFNPKNRILHAHAALIEAAGSGAMASVHQSESGK